MSSTSQRPERPVSHIRRSRGVVARASKNIFLTGAWARAGVSCLVPRALNSQSSSASARAFAFRRSEAPAPPAPSPFSVAMPDGVVKRAGILRSLCASTAASRVIAAWPRRRRSAPAARGAAREKGALAQPGFHL